MKNNIKSILWIANCLLLVSQILCEKYTCADYKDDDTVTSGSEFTFDPNDASFKDLVDRDWNKIKCKPEDTSSSSSGTPASSSSSSSSKKTQQFIKLKEIFRDNDVNLKFDTVSEMYSFNRLTTTNDWLGTANTLSLFMLILSIGLTVLISSIGFLLFRLFKSS